MSLHRRAAKRDANEPAIRRVVVEEFGGSFEPHSRKGGPDAFVGLAGMTEPWEIKNGNKKLNPDQETWRREWRGAPVQVVRTEAQARKRCRMLLDSRPALSTVLRAEHAALQSLEDDLAEEGNR